jgi:hypothetical protein
MLRFKVLKVVNTKIMVFWDMTLHSLEDISMFQRKFMPLLPTLKMEATGSFNTLVYIYHTTPQHTPEDHNLYT